MTLRLERRELTPEEGRYHRQSLIDWWDQDRVASARVLVIGAGALGNEVLKSLALLGAGRVLIYDMDSIERSNLNRSVLFRTDDEGGLKAEVAAERMRSLNPDVRARGRAENVVLSAGLGVFAWADVVIGALDNREARIFLNSACARMGTSWVDGAIEGFSGVVRAFDPADGACYECTMNATDRRQVAERRSCALLARDAVEQGHVPATVVLASLVGSMQVQEALKILHGRPALMGEGIHIDGLWNQFSRVGYPRRDDCMGHETYGEVLPLGVGVADVTLGELLDRAEEEFGPGAVLELSRDVISSLTCAECGREQAVRKVLGGVTESDAACPECGTHRALDLVASVSRGGKVDLSLTPKELGLPPFDVMLARRGLAGSAAWLFDGDAADVLGDLTDEAVAGGEVIQ